MDRETKIKIRILEGKKMAAQVNADKQEKLYSVYPHLPLLVFLLIFSIFLAWGIIDSWTNQTIVPIEEGITANTKILYGIWQFETRFHVYASWALIGAFIGVFVYLILKVAVSVRIMTLEYLKILSLNELLEEKKAELKKLPPNPDE